MTSTEGRSMSVHNCVFEAKSQLWVLPQDPEVLSEALQTIIFKYTYLLFDSDLRYQKRFVVSFL